MVRKIILFLLLLFFLSHGYGQYAGFPNLAGKQIVIKGDTTQLDTLSLVPGSVKITTSDGMNLDTSFYFVDAVKSILIHLNLIFPFL